MKRISDLLRALDDRLRSDVGSVTKQRQEAFRTYFARALERLSG